MNKCKYKNEIISICSECSNCTTIKNFLTKDMIADEYHTMNELYLQKALLFSLVTNANKNKSWKSLKHHDNTMYENHFIAGIDTDEGQYTFHLHVDFWDYYDIIELKNAIKYDGHKSSDISRLLSLNTRKNNNIKPFSNCMYFTNTNDLRYILLIHESRLHDIDDISFEIDDKKDKFTLSDNCNIEINSRIYHNENKDNVYKIVSLEKSKDSSILKVFV